MRLLFFGLLLILTSFAYCQTPFVTIKDVLKKNTKKPSSTILIENRNEKSLTTFIIDNETINGYMYKIINGNKQLIGKIQSEKLPKWYEKYVGHTIKDKQIRLIFKHNNDNKFASIFYDFASQRSLISEYDFKIKNQLYLETYSKGDQLYAFYASKKDNSLYVHNFSHNGGSSVKKHPLETKFIDQENKKKNLYQIMIGYGSNYYFDKFTNNNTHYFQKTRNKNKIYTRDNGVIFTVDNNKKSTYLISLNLPDFKPHIEIFNKPDLTPHKNNYTGNSFLFKDYLLQTKSNKEFMKCIITNISSKEILKELIIEKDKPVTFKNSPFIHIGSLLDKYQELENTNEFLKKTYGSSSVMLLETNFGYELTLGSVINISTSAPNLGANQGGFTFVNTGSRTKSTFIKCKFDKNFNYLEGELEPNVFDRINILIKDIKPIADIVSSFNGDYLYGTYNKSNKTYSIYKFEK